MAQTNSWKTLRESNCKVEDVVIGLRFLHQYGDFKYEANVYGSYEDEDDGEELFNIHYKGWGHKEDRALTANEILDQGYPFTKENAMIAAEEVRSAQVKKGYIKNENKSRASAGSSSSSKSRLSSQAVTSSRSKSHRIKKDSAASTPEIAGTPSRVHSQWQKKNSAALSPAVVAASPQNKSQRSKKEASASTPARSAAQSMVIKLMRPKNSSPSTPAIADTPSRISSQRSKKESIASTKANFAAPAQEKSQRQSKDSSALTPSTTDIPSRVTSQRVKKDPSASTPAIADTSSRIHPQRQKKDPAASTPAITDTPSQVKLQRQQKDSFASAQSGGAASPINKSQEKKPEVQLFKEASAAMQNESLKFPANLNISGIESLFPAKITIDEALDKYIHALKCGRKNSFSICDSEMPIAGIESLKAQLNAHLPLYFTEKEFPEFIKQLNLKREAKGFEPLNLDEYLEQPEVNKGKGRNGKKKETVLGKLMKVQLPLTDVFDVLYLIRFLKALNENREGQIKYMFAFNYHMWNDMLKFISEKVVKESYREYF